jgi:hypothetical protein
MQSLIKLKKEINEKFNPEFGNLFERLKYYLNNNVPASDPRSIELYEQLKRNMQ